MPYHKPFFLLSLLLFCTSILIYAYGRDFSTHSDILIFSPHPDDAVLCCAGLIQQALEQKQRVHIVEMTDGDGYVDAAVLISGKPKSSITLRDMLRLGRTRAHEEIRAMNILGLTRHDITLLGYPDGWLDEVYSANGSTPFTSPFTGISHSLNTGKPYTKQSVLSDISGIITKLRPNAIYVSGPTDSALDHQITHLLVTDAIRASGFSEQLLTYTIHATDSANLSQKSAITTKLSHSEQRIKSEAIESYTTQMALDGDYLRSFAGKEELFY